MNRTECKFLVPNRYLDEIRRMVQPFVEQDPYAARTGGTYTVRSIYYDTPHLSYYREKLEGLKMRKKLRIRGYNESKPDDLIFLEIKRRFNTPISKNRSPVRFSDLPQLLATGDTERYVQKLPSFKEAEADAQRFLYNLGRHQLVPVVTTVYDREAFVGKFDKSLRVTFDKNLRSEARPTLDALTREGRQKYVFKGHFVLEIKYYGPIMPVWGRTLTGRFGLRQEAVSKYAYAVDTHGLGRFPFTAFQAAPSTRLPRPSLLDARYASRFTRS
ncbi:MAG: polyphosphate polymerase domain-containing protein [Bacteroidota bacterium]